MAWGKEKINSEKLKIKNRGKSINIPNQLRVETNWSFKIIEIVHKHIFFKPLIIILCRVEK